MSNELKKTFNQTLYCHIIEYQELFGAGDISTSNTNDIFVYLVFLYILLSSVFRICLFSFAFLLINLRYCSCIERAFGKRCESPPRELHIST